MPLAGFRWPSLELAGCWRSACLFRLCYGAVRVTDTDLVQELSLRAWHMYIDVSFLPLPSSPHLDIRVHRQSNRTGVRSLYYSAIFLD